MTVGAALISNSACGTHDTGWGHVEHVGRLRAVLRAVGQDLELFHALRHVESRAATVEEIALCHAVPYVTSVRELAESGGGSLDSDTVVSSGSWMAALVSVGAVLDAVDMAYGDGPPRSFCAVRPPGHHALANAGMGFCLFGNVAIGAEYARDKYGVERVLIIDWDVHHGNGTQSLVENNSDIRFVSMHEWPQYPGTGAATERGVGNIWNVPMPAGRPAAEYRGALLHAIDQATADFVPDLVLLSAGFDSMAGDPLGGFTLETADFVTLTSELVSRAESWCSGRLISVLEGGYNTNLLGVATAAHMRELSGLLPR